MPYLVQQPLPTMLDNWDSFTAELFLVFGNPHLHTTSKSALRNLKMPDNSRVMEYIVAFNSHVPYTRYNDAALAKAFYQGLADHIKDQFQYMSREQEFTGLHQQALAFDEQYWQCEEERGRFPPSIQYGKRPSDSSCGNSSNTMKDRNTNPANNPPSNCPTPAPATTPTTSPAPAKPA